MHQVGDSEIVPAIQKHNGIKENYANGRSRRTVFRIIAVFSVCALLSCAIYGYLSKHGIDNSPNRSGVITENSNSSDNTKNEVIDEGKLIEFHVANLGGDPDKKGVFTIQTKPSWSKLGAERFEKLDADFFWDDCRFFRVVENFIVQWGINGNPKNNEKWSTAIEDEDVNESNSRGTVSFAMAGPGTRTHQMFINTKNNKFLDRMNFAPVGKVISGMDVVDQIYSGYGEKPRQDQITSKGNKYLEEMFPKLSYIEKTVQK